MLVVSFVALADAVVDAAPAGAARAAAGPAPRRRSTPCSALSASSRSRAVVYAGLAGTDSEQDNLAPTAIFVILWVGVPFASLLFGDVFRLLSPWRAIGRAVGWVVARVAPAEPLEYPERLGKRPAAAGILFFGIVELCWAQGREPQDARDPRAALPRRRVRGDELYGVEPWTRNADPFGVYFGLFASLAPVTRRDGVLYLPRRWSAPELPAGARAWSGCW